MGKRPSSWPFRDPVSLEDVPDYALIVNEPIDLKTIEKSWAIVSKLISSSSWRTPCVCAKIQDFTISHKLSIANARISWRSMPSHISKHFSEGSCCLTKGLTRIRLSKIRRIRKETVIDLEIFRLL